MAEKENPFETLKEKYASEDDAATQQDNIEVLDVEQLSKIVGGDPGEQCW